MPLDSSEERVASRKCPLPTDCLTRAPVEAEGGGVRVVVVADKLSVNMARKKAIRQAIKSTIERPKGTTTIETTETTPEKTSLETAEYITLKDNR